MLILKYPKDENENVKYYWQHIPHFSHIVRQALKKELLIAYSTTIAEKYAKIVAEYLHDNMSFPEDGVYRINLSNGHFIRYSIEQNSWVDTGTEYESYFITKNSPIWIKFFRKNDFLVSEKELIQNVVKTVSEKMFDENDTLRSLISVKLNHFSQNGNPCYFIEKIQQFFSEKKAKEVYLKIKDAMFHSTANNFVYLINNNKIIGALFEDKVLKCDDVDAVENVLDTMLDSESIVKVKEMWNIWLELK